MRQHVFSFLNVYWKDRGIQSILSVVEHVRKRIFGVSNLAFAGTDTDKWRSMCTTANIFLFLSVGSLFMDL
jgi:hypothetical protein